MLSGDSVVFSRQSVIVLVPVLNYSRATERKHENENANTAVKRFSCFGDVERCYIFALFQFFLSIARPV